MSLASISRVSAAVALALGLALSACARNTADDASMSGAYGPASGPGSIQEFASSVGDRVFFDTDVTELRRPSTNRRRGSTSTTATPSPSKATPTSVARANTISPSAPAAPKRPRTI
jgi:hypothetical protein